MESLLLMGRRDKRTWRGKIFKGTSGKARPKKNERPGEHGSNWWHSPHPKPAIPYPPQCVYQFCLLVQRLCKYRA
ncbi:hypothetical protein WJX74_000249 [Apatococcus lobatus]|uniref:Uncharacterized protein n=2 Tax=Apatococcus TaxID=904362 RepID=A0AAW1SZV7_9CHLO